METDSLSSEKEPQRLPGRGGGPGRPFAAGAPPSSSGRSPLGTGIPPGMGMRPIPPGMAPPGDGMPPGMGMGGKSMPSALAACRGAPPRSVLESTLYGFGGELALSARPYTYTDVFLSDRGRPHAFRGRARISSGVGMLTRKSSPARLPPGLAIVTDGPQCFGSAEPTPLGMIGCCASLAWLLAKLASGLRLVQSRAVSNVSSSVLTMGGIPALGGPRPLATQVFSAQ